MIKSISLVGPKRIHYERGETLTFYCDASGTDLQYAWQCTSMSVVKKLGKKKREVVTTTEEAEGEYRCQVKNDFGQVLSDPIEVEVGKLYSTSLVQKYMEHYNYSLKSLHYRYQTSSKSSPRDCREHCPGRTSAIDM